MDRPIPIGQCMDFGYTYFHVGYYLFSCWLLPTCIFMLYLYFYHWQCISLILVLYLFHDHLPCMEFNFVVYFVRVDSKWTFPYFVCVLQCMDFGYHNSVRCTMMMYQSCHKNISKTHQNAIEVIQKCVGDLDAQSDKQRFIELYNSAFMLPKKFDFQSSKGDEVSILMTLISVI